MSIRVAEEESGPKADGKEGTEAQSRGMCSGPRVRHFEILTGLQQPGWNDEDDDLGHPERKPEHRSSRSRKSESRSKKSSRHRKATGTCPDSNEDSDESDSDPTSIVYRNGRVPVLQQSALLRSILASATNEINKYAMTENFYPLGHELDKRIRKALHNAASQSEAQGSDRVAQLLKKDDRYGQDLGSVVRVTERSPVPLILTAFRFAIGSVLYDAMYATSLVAAFLATTNLALDARQGSKH